MSKDKHAVAGTVLKAASVTFAGQLYQLLLSLISALVVARLIGPAAFGVFNLARTLCESTALITKVGFDIGVVRYLGERNSRLADAETITVCRKILLAVSVISLIPVVLVAAGGGTWLEQHVYQHAQFGWVLAAMALSIPFMAFLQVLGGIFRGFLNIAPRVIAELCAQPTLRLLIFLVLFFIGWRLWAIVWGTVFSFILAAAFLYFWASRRVLRRPLPAPSPAHSSWHDVAAITRYSVVIAATVLMANLLSRTDVMLLGRFVSAENLGQYAIAQMLTGLLGTFNIALAQAAAPMIADLGKRGATNELGTVLHQHGRWVMITTLPIFFILLLYGNSLVSMLGEHYVANVPVISVLALSQLVTALFSSAGYTLSMTGRHKAELYLMTAGAAAAIVLNLLLIPRFGLLGGAIATLCSVFIANGLRVVLVARVYEVFPLGRDVLPSILAATIVFIGLFGLQKQISPLVGPIGSLVWIAISVMTYASAMLAFGLTVEDRELVSRLAGRLKTPSRR